GASLPAPDRSVTPPRSSQPPGNPVASPDPRVAASQHARGTPALPAERKEARLDAHLVVHAALLRLSPEELSPCRIPRTAARTALTTTNPSTPSASNAAPCPRPISTTPSTVCPRGTAGRRGISLHTETGGRSRTPAGS